MQLDFRTCPHCGGYGVRDNGHNCTECGGKGAGGLCSMDGVIGSGELMYDKATGRRVTHAEYVEHLKAKRAAQKGQP